MLGEIVIRYSLERLVRRKFGGQFSCILFNRRLAFRRIRQFTSLYINIHRTYGPGYANMGGTQMGGDSPNHSFADDEYRQFGAHLATDFIQQPKVYLTPCFF
jgi:hypothetical protein